MLKKAISWFKLGFESQIFNVVSGFSDWMILSF